MTLFDDFPVEPVWHECRANRCHGPVAAVCVGGVPLCLEHYEIEVNGPAAHILRPRLLAATGEARSTR